jgi:hypothetical protein
MKTTMQMKLYRNTATPTLIWHGDRRSNDATPPTPSHALGSHRLSTTDLVTTFSHITPPTHTPSQMQRPIYT